jgi:DNA-binding beta-propeller fold protein YncE
MRAFAAAVVLALGLAISPAHAEGPAYKVDTSWPQKLPNNWAIGDVAGVSVDKHNNIWIFQRPGTLSADDTLAGKSPPTAKCCVAAPPVLEFDTDGKLLRSWGGPSQVENWFESEHSVFVDDEDNVWLLGAGMHDGQVLKFTADGKLLLRIGKKGDFIAPNDTSMLARPTDMVVDTKKKELFVSDGYRNKRVIVFDSVTGKFKRQWTAFGKPVDAKYEGYMRVGDRPANPLERFTVVHCVTKIGDEVFVCDRTNSRVQVFTPAGKFLREFFVSADMPGNIGTVWDLSPVPGHPEQIIALDGQNSEINVLDNKTGKVISSYLSKGRFAGMMHWPHQIAVDQQGRLYVTEVDHTERLQRFVPTAP